MEKKYKPSKFDKLAVEILGWIFIIGIFLGILMDDYRQKLIWISFFAILMVIIIRVVDNMKEKKFNKENKK